MAAAGPPMAPSAVAPPSTLDEPKPSRQVQPQAPPPARAQATPATPPPSRADLRVPGGAAESARRGLPHSSQVRQEASEAPDSPRPSGPTEALRSEGRPGVAIRIERPQAGTTAQGVQPLTGRLLGGTAKEVFLSLNGEQQMLDVWGTKFEGEVGLRPGRNQIRVVAVGPRGILAEESREVQYAPPAPSSDIKIVSPTDGTVFDSTGPDVIPVEGTVSETATGTATVVFNNFTVPVGVREGRFATTIPLVGPVVIVWAEMRGEGGSRRSLPATVRTQPGRPPAGYVLLYLPGPAAKFDARVWLSHRMDPAELDGRRKVVMLPPSGGGGAMQPSMVFAFRQTQPGAYALALDYRLPPGDSVEKGWGLVLVPAAKGYRVLRLGPFSLSGKGRATLAKFLLPHGVFWDEDSWFNGTAEGAEAVTKFRYSEGVSWSERKGEPEFPAPR